MELAQQGFADGRDLALAVTQIRWVFWEIFRLLQFSYGETVRGRRGRYEQ